MNRYTSNKNNLLVTRTEALAKKHFTRTVP